MDHLTPALSQVGTGSDEQYRLFLAEFKAGFSRKAKGRRTLFRTDVGPAQLWEAYLGAFPTLEERQHHNCNACRHFIQLFGGLVVIGETGVASSAFWHEAIDNPYAKSFAAMRKLVNSAKVVGVFSSSVPGLGLPKNHDPVHGCDWHHLSADLPAAMVRPKSSTDSDGQYEARKTMDYRTVVAAITEHGFVQDVTTRAVHLLTTAGLYRADKVLPLATFLNNLNLARAGAGDSRVRAGLTWLAVSQSGGGFCTPRTGMLGYLCEALIANKHSEEIRAVWESRMSADVYQTARAAPTTGAVKASEDLVAKLGVAPAFARRYASSADILEFVWSPPKAKAGPTAPGLFSKVKTKDAQGAPPPLDLPMTVMTWAKFSKTVLPSALKLEARIPADSSRFMALVTAQDPLAPPVLAWDRGPAENRNPVSWYYSDGMDASIKRKVIAAGGQYDNVDIRASLAWSNRNDLDLHCVTPAGVHIYFGNKNAGPGCGLDVDMNVRGETEEPVENIRWTKGKAQPGRYTFYVENFQAHVKGDTPFIALIVVNGEVHRMSAIIPYGAISVGSRVVVGVVNYGAKNVWTPGITGQQEPKSGKVWGLLANGFTEVTAIVPSPNMWGAESQPQFGNHLFFLLSGCQPEAGVGRGLLAETLRGELRPAKAVISAYLKDLEIWESPGAPACGLGMPDQTEWNLVLRVTSAAGHQLVKIDRAD